MLAGSAEDIHAAMRNAGWVQADEITLRSAWGIVKSSVFGSSYPEAPVSDLFLFGRRHAFAYQQEVDGNAAQRHHIRFWHVPEGWLLPGGRIEQAKNRKLPPTSFLLTGLVILASLVVVGLARQPAPLFATLPAYSLPLSSNFH